ncbi:MAG: ATP-dependent DNA ligase [Vicinamibacterales bacterium]
MPSRRVSAGASPADDLPAVFPSIDLPIAPPYAPMEAAAAPALPQGAAWAYEPKWDGFRCLAFKNDGTVLLQSKAGQALTRYFPEVASALERLPRTRFVLDGELVVVREGRLAFDQLLQRIHPAASRVRRLAVESPAVFVAFDLLVDPRGRLLAGMPMRDRRARLEAFFDGLSTPDVRMSVWTSSLPVATRWMDQLGGAGLDGVVAKAQELPYRSGTRDGMVKVKRLRSADCIVGGYRYQQSGAGIGSLLLGLMNAQGAIDHVGFTASFTADERRALAQVVEPLRGGTGFTGRAPGGPSRWSAGRTTDWVPLHPRLVCEVRYDHYADGRFRHGTKFLRWRPDKMPEQCTFAQVEPRRDTTLLRTLGL